LQEDLTKKGDVSENSERSSESINPPWFPSLMAFEHYDCARTHLFPDAKFGGSFTGRNKVSVRPSPSEYPTPYNIAYLGPEEIFIYGGGYGDVKGGTGAFVAKVHPVTLKTAWYNKLIDTVVTNEWDYPGVLSILRDGYLYVIYGYRLAKLNPKDGSLIGKPLELPTLAAQRDTSYNGLDALADGTLIAKTVYREAGCEEQGFSAFLGCPHSDCVPNSLVVAIDPTAMEVVAVVAAPEFIGGRLTTTRFEGRDYIYLAGTTTAFRYVYEDNEFRRDRHWDPGRIYLPGQTGASAMVVMNDWVVMQTNSAPANTLLSVVAINQKDASVLRREPFRKEKPPRHYPSTYPPSLAPASVSVDPEHNLIYALDAGVGQICCLRLRNNRLHKVWAEYQPTTEFLALIGTSDRRVVVGTEVPRSQLPGYSTEDFVVWRDTRTGKELARTPDALPAISTGTLVEPYYSGRMYYLAQKGQIIELSVQPEKSQSNKGRDRSNRRIS
jgi:hypothetical protein